MLAQARAAPPAGRRHNRSPPSGIGRTASGRPGSGHPGRGDPSRRARARRRRRPAMAIRWTTALVEPPRAPLARIAFSKAARVRMREIRRSSRTIATARLPVRWATWRRRASTAGIAALPGRLMPSASARLFMVEAVPMVMQWPAERLMQHSASMNSASGHLAGPDGLGEAPDVGAGADRLALVLAVQHRAAGEHDAPACRRRRRPSGAPGGLVAAGHAGRRRRSGWRGSTPRRPWRRGCGTASRSGAGCSRRSRRPGTRAGSRRPRRRRASRTRPARGSARCRGSGRRQVLQMPMTGRPSKRWSGKPWFFIQLRWMKPSLSWPPNQAALRRLLLSLTCHLPMSW